MKIHGGRHSQGERFAGAGDNTIANREPAKQPPLLSVSLRPAVALLVGASGVALLCAITPYNDYHLKNTFLYGNHLPIGALCLFTLLAWLVNPLLRRLRPALALNTVELLIAWSMWATGASLASSGLWRYLGPMVVAPAYFANAGRRWIEALSSSPGAILLSKDPNSPLIRWFYEGIPSGTSIPYLAWIPVLVSWGILFGLFTTLFIALCALLRKQWVERERLTFPLAVLPLEIAAERAGSPLYRNRFFWAGVFIVFAHHGINTAHTLSPSVPGWLAPVDTNAWFPDPPWNALGFGVLEIFFAVIGAVYLLPVEVSFSLWFTFLVLHLVRVVRVQMGLDPLMIGPLHHEGAMGTGALIAWALWMLWAARPHWQHLWRVLTAQEPHADRHEPMSYRTAVLLVGVCLTGILAWLYWAGIPLWIAATVTLLFALIMVVLTRVVAEAGLLFVQTPFIPTDAMAFFGTSYFTTQTASATLLMEVIIMHDPREHPMPAVANAYSLARPSLLPARWLTRALALALCVGFTVGFFAFVGVSYRYGSVTLDYYGTNMAPHWSLDRALGYGESPLRPHSGGILAMGIGGALSLWLGWMRSRYIWWQISPIGLVMASTYAMGRIYFSVFLGWLLRWLCVRLGGLHSYRRYLPFFLGLLLGEALYGGLAALFGALTGAPVPQFLPN